MLEISKRLEERLNRRHNPGCVQFPAVALTFGTVAACLALLIFPLYLLWLIPLILLLVLVWAPMTGAAIAAMLTVRDTTSDEYALLKLTPLEDQVLVNTYWRWVGRSTVPLLVVHGLIMALLGTVIYSSVFSDRASDFWQFYDEPQSGADTISFGLTALDDHDNTASNVARGAVVFTVITMFWNIYLVGVAWGVALGVWWRSMLAVVVAPMLALGTWLGAVVLIFTILPVPNGSQWDIVALLWLPVFNALPLALTYALLRIGSLFARR